MQNIPDKHADSMDKGWHAHCCEQWKYGRAIDCKSQLEIFKDENIFKSPGKNLFI